jgi:TonB-linked SusC/RagA family outer membrane protein
MLGSFTHAQSLGSLHLSTGPDKADGQLVVEEGVSVEQALKQVEQQFNVVFLYRTDALVDKKVSATKVLSSNVEKALEELLEEQELVFKYLNPKTYGIYEPEKALVKKEPIVEQVSGQVTDAQSGETLPGVNILVKGTTTGASTDQNGNFDLEVPSLQDTLVVTFIGYQTKEVPINGRTDLDIILQPQTIQGEEMVVIGYGKRKKKLTTGANLNVSAENLQEQQTSEPMDALQSQASGVNITQSSGMPGEGYKVNIRGLGTVGNSDPLYVIDGVAGGDISNLNPADIESIDVLKDAASAAIYGARAANGVILVSTKQGQRGDLEVTYDGWYGIQNVENMAEPLNASQFIEIYNEERTVSGKNPIDFSSVIPGLYDQIQSGQWKGTDWMQEIYNQNAPVQNHAINFSTGTEQSVYSFGISYAPQEGVLGKPVEPISDKYTVRLNSDHVIYENNDMDVVTFGQTLNYSYRERSGIAVGDMYYNDIRNMLVGNPLVPVYDEQGEYYNSDDLQESGLAGLSARLYNPVGQMEYDRGMNTTKNHNINSSAYLEVQPINNLVFRSQFGYRMGANSYRSYQPAYNLAGDVSLSPGRISQSSGSGYDWTFENTLNYSFDVNRNTFDLLLGQSIEKWGLGESIETTNANPTFNGYDYAYVDNTDGLTSGVTSVAGAPYGRGSLASFFGRVNYDYDEKYLLALVMRADGSSNFAEGNRWGFFPSVSAGWVLTEESFMEGNDVFDLLKLRASWGQNGNSNVAAYQYLSPISFDADNNYTFGSDPNQQQLGGYPSSLPNEDISWETSEQLDIGLDAYFLDSRLQFVFDYYKKTTVDWLVRAPIPDIYGAGAPYINGGDVENTGYEFALSWDDVIGDFNYGANFNISTNENEVTRLANSEGIIRGPANIISQGTDPVYRAEVGYPIGYFYGYKIDGIFQNQQQIDNWENGFLQDDPQPGDVMFSDTDGNNEVTPEDKTLIGNPHPDARIGFGINLGYKGVDFSLSGIGAFGHQIMKSYRSFADNEYHNYTTDIYDKRWHGEGTSNTFPRLSSGNSTNRINISEIYVEDADYVKITNVKLGYDFKNLIPEMPVVQARFYVAARNVLTFTNYSGMDPQVGYGDDESWVSGVDLGFYPNPRTFLMGLNLKF